jgi:hypothetical protein
MRFLRNLVVLMFTGGGVWLAFWLVGLWALASGEQEFHLTREGIPLLIPVGMVGALVGAFIGSVFFPAQR